MDLETFRLLAETISGLGGDAKEVMMAFFVLTALKYFLVFFGVVFIAPRLFARTVWLFKALAAGDL